MPAYLRILLLFIGLFASSLAIATTMMAITEFELEISEGEFITVRSAGNAQSQWLETANGDIIVKRSGTWYLAEINSQNQALSTGIPYREGEVIPAEIVFIPDLSLSAALDTIESTSVVSQSVAISSSDGVTQQPILVLRVSFLDQDPRYSSELIHELIFADESSSSLSVAQYYRDNSYQKFDIQPVAETSGTVNDGIIDVALSYNHPNFGSSYGSASSKLVSDALISANSYINFSAFDENADGSLSSRELGVVLIIAGYENAYGGAGASEPKVWAHKSSISPVSLDGVSLSAYAMFGEQHQDHLATIGIISHEMAHLLFSIPDLYDRQGDSNGVGRWGLMGLGSWNSRDGVAGSSPAHLLAWSKVEAGFMHPRDVEGDSIEFSLASATNENDALRVWLDPFRHGEHFLMEYRVREGADIALPGAGLLISHIDDWVGYGTAGLQNDVVEHKLVDIEEADGQDDMDLLENRGDREDVYSDVYGQDYFGSSSLPASLDYQGNSSGVEVAQIRVGDEVTGNLSLPYEQLGNNLGYDDGGIRAAWGSGGSVSLVEYSVPSDSSFAHGIDFYSYRNAVISTSLYTSFTGGSVSNALHVSSSTITPGWNRIEFSSSLDLSSYSKVYLEITASADSLRAFGIDNEGDVSGNSYIKLNGSFQSAGFDFNQRLLVASQEEGFNYQIPDKLSLQEIEVSGSSSSGGGGGSFGLFLILAALLASFRINFRVCAV
jgi:M6 family metalloprotease-like protein